MNTEGETKSNPDLRLTITVYGESSIGKSKLLMRYRTGKKKDDSLYIIGNFFVGKTINIEGKEIKLKIYDLNELSENKASIIHSYLQEPMVQYLFIVCMIKNHLKK